MPYTSYEEKPYEVRFDISNKKSGSTMRFDRKSHAINHAKGLLATANYGAIWAGVFEVSDPTEAIWYANIGARHLTDADVIRLAEYFGGREPNESQWNDALYLLPAIRRDMPNPSKESEISASDARKLFVGLGYDGK